jgi:quercetin dioxygenase-like cupin family protein
MDVRQVVTGRDAEGKSVFVSDEIVPPITIAMAPGSEWHRLWGSDVPPALPSDGTPPAQPDYFPPAGGYRLGFFTLAPDSWGPPDDIDWAAARAEVEEKLPRMFEVNERENPGMHTTDTIDWLVVISGEVWLELDGGAEQRLGPGDCIIQNGTRHAWHNRSDEPCVMIVVLLGAARGAAPG